MKLLWTLLLLSLSATPAFAKKLLFLAPHHGIKLNAQTGYFEQRIDHSNPFDTRTFTQRYFYDTEFASGPDAPVFFVFCGEGECSPGWWGGSPLDLAKAHHANIISLEHRYYGTSRPFPELTPENLVHLTVENALEDVVAFQAYVKSSMGLTGKWVTFGYSYAGILSAYYREKHPDLVVGALASSAPVKAITDFDEFDHHAAVAAGPVCASQIRAAMVQLESLADDSTKFPGIKARFGAGAIDNEIDFLYYVADKAAQTMQYGGRDHFCQAMAQKGDPIANLIQGTLDIGPPVGDVAQGNMDLNPAPEANGRQWFYQTCAELGWFQPPYHDASIALRSSKLDMSYFLDQCRQLFGTTALPKERKFNRRYYLPLLAPSTTRIFFVNGSNDPWMTASIATYDNNLWNPFTSAFTIPGGSHCEDLNSMVSGEDPGLAQAHQMLSGLITEWLQ